MDAGKVLIVDDERKIRSILGEILRTNGFVPVEAEDGRQALDAFGRERPATVLLDLKMPGMSGAETLRELKKIDAGVPVIIVTAHGDIPTAVESIKLGAYDFILKPPDFNALILTLNRAIEKYGLEKEVKRLNTAVEASFQETFGTSRAMLDIIGQVKQVAKSDFSVILQGETGTGKSFFARAIHNLSERARGPFVTVDMGALPESLIENELFGHEKGAFTGAERAKKGFFEAAYGGTILIDDLENVSPYMQSKLLRVIEEKEIYPLGSGMPVKIDARFITATNEDMGDAVRRKRFREDLFYRLGEFTITIPPLRERSGDIAFLSARFLREAAEELKKPAIRLDDDALDVLKGYQWPGNVRELKNAMRRMALMTEGPVIGRGPAGALIGRSSPDCAGRPEASRCTELPCLGLRDLEIHAIRKALDVTRSNRKKAAHMLQIDYTTLLRKMKQYGISP